VKGRVKAIVGGGCCPWGSKFEIPWGGPLYMSGIGSAIVESVDHGRGRHMAGLPPRVSAQQTSNRCASALSSAPNRNSKLLSDAFAIRQFCGSDVSSCSFASPAKRWPLVSVSVVSVVEMSERVVEVHPQETHSSLGQAPSGRQGNPFSVHQASKGCLARALPSGVGSAVPGCRPR